MAIVPDLSGRQPTDLKYCSPNRFFATTANVLAATPAYSGELVLALDTGIRYRGLDLTAGHWGQVTVPLM